MENKEKLLQVLAALDTIPVKGFEQITTMAGCMQVLRDVAASLPAPKEAPVEKSKK